MTLDLKEIPERVISGFQTAMDGTGEEGQNLEKAVKKLHSAEKTICIRLARPLFSCYY